MSITRKHDRRQRLVRQRESEIKAVTARACKKYSIGVNFSTPEATISALEKYIDDLRAVQEELMERYPGEIRQLWRLKVEIDTAVEAISQTRIQQVKPS